MKYLIRKDMENIEAAVPHTPICPMLKRNMCCQRKQGTRVFVVYFQWAINSDTTLAEFNFSLVIHHTTHSKHVNWDAWYLVLGYLVLGCLVMHKIIKLIFCTYFKYLLITSKKKRLPGAKFWLIKVRMQWVLKFSKNIFSEGKIAKIEFFALENQKNEFLRFFYIYCIYKDVLHFLWKFGDFLSSNIENIFKNIKMTPD